MRILTITLLALAIASPAAARSVRALNPLDCARTVNLELVFGGALDTEGDNALAFFQGDEERADTAQERILAALTELLAKNGIAVGPDGRWFSIRIYGRPVGGECTAQSVFTGALSASYDDPDDSDEGVDSWEQHWLDVVPDDRLEEEITQDLLAIVTDLVSGRLIEECKPRHFRSMDGKHRFDVSPMERRSRIRYFKEQRAGWEEAGLQPGPEDDWPRGTLYDLTDGGGYVPRAVFRLAREYFPDRAIVTDDGKYVVMFDPDHGLDEGYEAIIYRSDGTVVRSLSLEDLLTPGDVEAISLGGAGSQGRFIGARVDGGRLILQMTPDGATFRLLRVDLSTGSLLEPKRDLLPHFRVASGAYVERAGAAISWGDPVCASEGSFESRDLVSVPPEAFYARVRESPPPVYPEVAKRARPAMLVRPC